MNIKINNRLQKISDFISSKDKVIDIGCDHGLLGIYLVLKKNVSKMVSSDLNELPLKKAKENVLKYNLENKIELRLGNGLEALTNDLDTIIISGMGGLTINMILQDIKKYSYIKKLVISPNTDFKETRKVITKLGFKLMEEQIVFENKKYYLISYYEKGKRKRIDYRFGKLDNNEETRKYYSYLLERNNTIIKNLGKKQILKKIKLLIENKKILRNLER